MREKMPSKKSPSTKWAPGEMSKEVISTVHFAKMPGFSHDMLLKDAQASYSSPRETLLAQKLLQKTVGVGSSMMSFSWNMSITT